MLRGTRIRILVVGLAGALLLSLVVAGLAWERASRFCRTFQVFCDYVRQGNWAAAQKMVAAEQRRLRVGAGAVYYGDADITRAIADAQPSVAETFKHYFTHSGYGNAVLFQLGGMPCNYVFFQDGKIKYMKIP